MLINKGYVFKSETDTEVGAALLDYLYSKNNDMIYTGKELTPKPVITWNGFTLVEDVDYEIRYFENVNAGYGTMVIYGMGNFCGTQRVQLGFSVKVLKMQLFPRFLTRLIQVMRLHLI